MEVFTFTFTTSQSSKGFPHGGFYFHFYHITIQQRVPTWRFLLSLLPHHNPAKGSHMEVFTFTFTTSQSSKGFPHGGFYFQLYHITIQQRVPTWRFLLSTLPHHNPAKSSHMEVFTFTFTTSQSRKGFPHGGFYFHFYHITIQKRVPTWRFLLSLLPHHNPEKGSHMEVFTVTFTTSQSSKGFPHVGTLFWIVM